MNNINKSVVPLLSCLLRTKLLVPGVCDIDKFDCAKLLPSIVLCQSNPAECGVKINAYLMYIDIKYSNDNIQIYKWFTFS
jgi:hypothetical protein